MPHFRVILERFTCATLPVTVEAADAVEAQAVALRNFGHWAPTSHGWEMDLENVSKVMVREVSRERF
jgi:hypothetical protein